MLMIGHSDQSPAALKAFELPFEICLKQMSGRNSNADPGPRREHRRLPHLGTLDMKLSKLPIVDFILSRYGVDWGIEMAPCCSRTCSVKIWLVSGWKLHELVTIGK